MRFTFSLTGTPIQADGIAFVIQTDGPWAIGRYGGDIGLVHLHGVASVIHTYINNHLGFTLDANPFDAKDAPTNLGKSSVITGREYIDYDVVNHVLTMSGHIVVDGRHFEVNDRAEVDLAALLGTDSATFGFTGGTGGLNSDQRITGWSIVTR